MGRKDIAGDLREIADDIATTVPSYGWGDMLEELAYRIDSEMVELPWSADGQIWTGREVCFWTDEGSGAYHRFYALVRRDGNWYVEDTCGIRYSAESVWHKRPDGLERIADDLDEVVDAARSADDMREKLADLADRIRKLAAEEATR